IDHLARLDVHVLRLFLRGFPVAAEAHLLGSLRHLPVAPLELFVRQRDQLLRRIRNPRAAQFLQQLVMTHRADAGNLLFTAERSIAARALPIAATACTSAAATRATATTSRTSGAAAAH